jgi:hypothetical protein
MCDKCAGWTRCDEQITQIGQAESLCANKEPILRGEMETGLFTLTILGENTGYLEAQ